MQRRTRLLSAAAAALTLNFLVLSAAAAQTTASATADATATVVGIAPLTANTLNDLDFGSVTAGTNGTVAPVDGARFQITGEPTFPVNVTFALPANLTGPGGATIPIFFGTTDGLLWAPFPGTFSTFNPNAVFATNVDGAGLLEIGLTGTVSPPTATVSGVYSGTITVTVAY